MLIKYYLNVYINICVYIQIHIYFLLYLLYSNKRYTYVRVCKCTWVLLIFNYNKNCLFHLFLHYLHIASNKSKLACWVE